MRHGRRCACFAKSRPTLHAEARLGRRGRTAARAALLERSAAAHAETRTRRVLGPAALAGTRRHATTLLARAHGVEGLLLRPEVLPARHLAVPEVEEAADRYIHLDPASFRDHVQEARRQDASATEVPQLE